MIQRNKLPRDENLVLRRKHKSIVAAPFGLKGDGKTANSLRLQNQGASIWAALPGFSRSWETHSPASADSSMPPLRATVDTASLFSTHNRALLYVSLPCLLIWVSEPVFRNSLSTTSPQTVSTLNALQTSREAASLIKTMMSLERCLL